MSNVPADLRYLKSHEWARLEGDGTVTIGISDHAQQALGDLVFVEAPEAGRRVSAGEACAVVESVKAASDIYSPVTGEVIASNVDLGGQPELSTPTRTAPAGSCACARTTRRSSPRCSTRRRTRPRWPRKRTDEEVIWCLVSSVLVGRRRVRSASRPRRCTSH